MCGSLWIETDYDPGSKWWKWQVSLDEFKKDERPIGEGKFSVVYRGKLHGTPCALKVLKVSTLNDSVIQSFNYEVGLMR
jgi:predicted Ser/Thr protein kinase